MCYDGESSESPFAVGSELKIAKSHRAGLVREIPICTVIGFNL